MITKNNHPYKNQIIGMKKEYLSNRKLYVECALSEWKRNSNDDLFCRQIYNITYFKIELELINLELCKHEKEKQKRARAET